MEAAWKGLSDRPVLLVIPAVEVPEVEVPVVMEEVVTEEVVTEAEVTVEDLYLLLEEVVYLRHFTVTHIQEVALHTMKGYVGNISRT